MLVAYCRLCLHGCNLAEGGCLLSWFHFTHCHYFLGYVACRNLPWQGLYKVSFFGLHALFEVDVNYKNTNLNGDGHISIWDSHIMEGGQIWLGVIVQIINFVTCVCSLASFQRAAIPTFPTKVMMETQYDSTNKIQETETYANDRSGSNFSAGHKKLVCRFELVIWAVLCLSHAWWHLVPYICYWVTRKVSFFIKIIYWIPCVQSSGLSSFFLRAQPCWD